MHIVFTTLGSESGGTIEAGVPGHELTVSIPSSLSALSVSSSKKTEQRKGKRSWDRWSHLVGKLGIGEERRKQAEVGLRMDSLWFGSRDGVAWTGSEAS